MARSLRSKRVQANKRVMREKSRTLDTQKHEDIAQKLHETTQSFNMSSISTLRKNLYQKPGDDADMPDNREIYKKILGVQKTIEKPKRTVPGPATTAPSNPSRGTTFLKFKNLPYRPRQYQRSHKRLSEYNPETARTAEAAMEEMEEEEELDEDETKQYQTDLSFMENFHKNLKDNRSRLRDICPPAKLYFLSTAERFAQEEKKAKDFAIEHYKKKGSTAVPDMSIEKFDEQRRNTLMQTAKEVDKASLLTKEEAIAFYQREADGSTVIDDVKVFLPAGFGRFGFVSSEDILIQHLSDVVDSFKEAADHKARYSLFRKDHERSFNNKAAAARKRIQEYQTKHKITKKTTEEEKKTMPLGLQMRERINKLRGDFMKRGTSTADNSSLRNASVDAIHKAKEIQKAKVKAESINVQKTIKKLNKGRKQKYGREKNNLGEAATRYINKEFATAMATRNIMYGNK